MSNFGGGRPQQGGYVQPQQPAYQAPSQQQQQQQRNQRPTIQQHGFQQQMQQQQPQYSAAPYSPVQQQHSPFQQQQQQRAHINGPPCAKCGLICDAQGFIALKDGSNYHKTCFTCEYCQLGLQLKFISKNGKFFHADCYNIVKQQCTKCEHCQQYILPNEQTTAIALESGACYHGQCFTCDQCGLALGELVLPFDRLIFHQECMSCVNCSRSLGGTQYDQLENGYFACLSCLAAQWPEQYGPMLRQQQSQQMQQPPFNPKSRTSTAGSQNGPAHYSTQPIQQVQQQQQQFYQPNSNTSPNIRPRPGSGMQDSNIAPVSRSTGDLPRNNQRPSSQQQQQQYQQQQPSPNRPMQTPPPPPIKPAALQVMRPKTVSSGMNKKFATPQIGGTNAEFGMAAPNSNAPGSLGAALAMAMQKRQASMNPDEDVEEEATQTE